MYEDIDALLKEVTDFDWEAVLTSLNEPPLEVLLKDLHESTEAIFRELGYL